MFLFTAKFLTRMPTAATTIMPDAAKTAAANHLQSRLLLERQRRATRILNGGRTVKTEPLFVIAKDESGLNRRF